MKEEKTFKTSLADVARAAGISKAAASYALQNRPKVSPATRKRVQGLARQLGYVPDARLTSWMVRVRETKTKDLLPIAWLNTDPEQDAWNKYRFLSPYLDGARKQALQSGYGIEEIWACEPGMTMRRISQILYQRGIEGVIISSPARHFRLNWDHLAGVSIGRGLLAPRLHQITNDIYFNFLLALKMVRRYGYRRIGICLEEGVDRQHTHHAIRATTHYLNSMTVPSRRVDPLFYSWRGRLSEKASAAIIEWIKKQRPDVIIGHSHYLVRLAEAAGYRVPQDLGIVHLATDDDVSDWAGVCSNKREIGAGAVKLVVSSLQARKFGVPEIATNTLIRGTWQAGRTLIIPKPK